jgi:hypothetical protein
MDEKRFELNVNAPETYAVDLTLPEEVRGYGNVTVNGKPADAKTGQYRLSSPVYVKAVKQ